MSAIREDSRALIRYALIGAVITIMVAWALYLAREAVLLIYLSAVVAIGLGPVVKSMERSALFGGRVHLKRWQAILLLYMLLLGLIIEKVTGRRYQDVLTERFLRPLGMEATVLSRQEASATERADVYALRDGQLRPLGLDVHLEMPSFYGAFSTVVDLLRWESALARGAVVPRRSLDEMWTPSRLNDGTAGRYGLGIQVTSRSGRRMLVQSGITGTEWVRFPDDGVTVVVLTNLGLVPGGLAPSVAAHFIPGLGPGASHPRSTHSANWPTSRVRRADEGLPAASVRTLEPTLTTMR